jgi:hypothetical protein
MKCIWIIIFCLISCFILLSVCFKKEKYTTNTTPKGIVFFDIDGTLTHAIDKDRIIQVCLDYGFRVGIVSASFRSRDDACKQSWMPPKLCKLFSETDFELFNTLINMNGKLQFPQNYPYKESYGYKKGFAMVYSRDHCVDTQNIPDSRLILFDDDPGFIRDVKRFNPQLRVVCGGSACSGGLSRLTPELVEGSLKRILNK